MAKGIRTRVTLEPDVVALLRTAIRERGLSFDEAVNVAVRAGLPRERARMPTYALGEPLVPLDKALQVAADLEDEELIRRLAAGK